jgi:hypothetical protein
MEAAVLGKLGQPVQRLLMEEVVGAVQLSTSTLLHSPAHNRIQLERLVLLVPPFREGLVPQA